MINQSTSLNNASHGQNDVTSNGSPIIQSPTDGCDFEKNRFFPDNELSEEFISKENFKTQKNKELDLFRKILAEDTKSTSDFC